MALTDSSNIHGEFISINNMLNIYEEIKEKNQKPNKKIMLDVVKKQ